MKVIAITGGPCAGKTSAIAVLRERLSHAPIPVVFVDEAATDLINEGISPWTCASMLEFQTHIMALQLKREQEARAQVAGMDDAVIICDRGICDGRGYVSAEDYQRALEANGISHEQALARYDAVFLLESIAADDPESYTQENNAARFEDLEEAIRTAERVAAAWADHPELHVIGNRADFADKADDLYSAIVKYLGLPQDEDARSYRTE